MDSLGTLVAFVFVALVLMALERARRNWQRSELSHLLRNGRVARAEVVEVWAGGEGEGWNITYRFTDPLTGAQITRTQTETRRPPVPISVGTTLDVAFDPKAPRYSQIIFSQASNVP